LLCNAPFQGASTIEGNRILCQNAVLFLAVELITKTAGFVSFKRSALHHDLTASDSKNSLYMTTNACFYVLNQEHGPDTTVPAHFDLAAKIALEQFRSGERVFVYIDDIALAHQFDEHLWQFEADSFVPHNLQGEGPKGGAPVEIGVTPPVGRRTVLINLSMALPDFIRRFNQVFDFVPVEAVQKQAARERFKQLRQLGAVLSTQEISQ